jgi:hypothetical protein
VNLGLDAARFIASMPAAAVQEIHLAGHRLNRVADRDLLIDDHGSAVCDDVWALYQQAIARLGPVPTLIEWDTDVPSLDVLVAEARKADGYLEKARELAA